MLIRGYVEIFDSKFFMYFISDIFDCLEYFVGGSILCFSQSLRNVK